MIVGDDEDLVGSHHHDGHGSGSGDSPLEGGPDAEAPYETNRDGYHGLPALAGQEGSGEHADDDDEDGPRPDSKPALPAIEDNQLPDSRNSDTDRKTDQPDHQPDHDDDDDEEEEPDNHLNQLAPSITARSTTDGTASGGGSSLRTTSVAVLLIILTILCTKLNLMS